MSCHDFNGIKIQNPEIVPPLCAVRPHLHLLYGNLPVHGVRLT
jgi:hypothetical protein